MNLGGILQKACVPRDSFFGFLHLASAKCTLLCKMHTLMLNGNCLVELNLTSKRNSGWVGGFYYLHRSRCVVIVLWDTPAGSAGGTSRDDASWPEPNSHPDAKILVPPKNPGSILQRAGGPGGSASETSELREVI